ncbi:cellular retinoic acid-binding protein 2 [Platysternon megacephalum]|uniref:Cellular retinoic acid-binding protein 2 n=1 Tax=Platysternon megacephalum TaxID=55544 RepID=A0A4D9E8R8_9SAUR|nr:cellular retinoic acid-binding protein 2 [Platysternon megacephalum]
MSYTIHPFGDLLSRIDKKEKANPMDEAANRLVPLLLHLQDENEAVVEACKYVLRCLAPYFKWTMKKKVITNKTYYNLQLVLRKTSKHLVEKYKRDNLLEYIYRSMRYLKCKQAFIKRVMAIFLGYLINMDDSLMRQVDLDILIRSKLLNCEAVNF